MRAWDVPDGRYRDIQFVTDNTFTHAVLFNCPQPNLTIPKENVVGFAQEPRPNMQFSESFLQWACENVETYFLDDIRGLPPNFRQGHQFITPGVCWDTRYHVYPKPKMMSIVASEKHLLQGHKLRHALIQRILRTDLGIDIWGRQTERYSDMQGLGRVKGTFATAMPYKDYKYIIAIENHQNDYYYSEKFCWCLEKNCIPVYFGAKKIKEWYGDCCVELPADPDAAMEIIRDTLENDPYDFNYDSKDVLYEELYFPQFLINYFNQAKAMS